MPKSRVVRAFSAGGVVYRRGSSPDGAHSPRAAQSSEVEVVLVGDPAVHMWVLPKGTPIKGETKEQTACREVEEETGIRVRIVGELGSIHYWFARKGVRFSKEVFHYLMEEVGGDVSLHDHEYPEARWVPLQDAVAMLSHANEAEIVRRAQQRLSGGNTEPSLPQADATAPPPAGAGELPK